MVAPPLTKRLAWQIPRTLLAGLALLLGATHCVEIDDRDLDVNSGDDSNLPPECRRDSDDTACFACSKSECCYELQLCLGSADCLLYTDCAYNCGDDSSCISACGDALPEGEVIFDYFLACGMAECGC